MGYIESIFEGLQKVDLLKWVVTVAIPTCLYWPLKWIFLWFQKRAVENQRKRNLHGFIFGLPQKVQDMLADTFIREKSHTVILPCNDDTVRLAVGLGIITEVSNVSRTLDFYYTLRGDIWDYLHENIILRHMSNPPDQGTDQESNE